MRRVHFVDDSAAAVSIVPADSVEVFGSGAFAVVAVPALALEYLEMVQVAHSA